MVTQTKAGTRHFPSDRDRWPYLAKNWAKKKAIVLGWSYNREKGRVEASARSIRLLPRSYPNKFQGHMLRHTSYRYCFREEIDLNQTSIALVLVSKFVVSND